MSGQDVPGGSHLAELAERIGAATAAIERIGREVAERTADGERARAEAARRGELGPDWRALQTRIDRGETSLEAVFGGEDDSPEARRLVEASRQRLAEMATRPTTEAEAALAEIAALRARIAEMDAGLGDGPAGPRGQAGPAAPVDRGQAWPGPGADGGAW